jgi:hypothetical protein
MKYASAFWSVPAVLPMLSAACQGITLVHFSAQRKQFYIHRILNPRFLEFWGK